MLLTRAVAAERAALARLTAWGFHVPSDSAGHCFLKGQDAILRFFARGMPELQLSNGRSTSARVSRTSASRSRSSQPEAFVRGSGEDWFELEISLASREGQRFSASDIQRLLQSGQGSTRLQNGRLAVLPAEALHDLQEVLRDCDPNQVRPGVYRLQRAQGTPTSNRVPRQAGRPACTRAIVAGLP